MISIPALPSGFSNALLTEILQEHGCLPSIGAVSGLTQSLIGDGTGNDGRAGQVERDLSR